MQQSGCVDEFDHRSHGVALRSFVSDGLGHEQQQSRTQALATGGNDVLGNLTDQRNARGEALLNDVVHGQHVLGDQGEGCGRGVRRS